MNVNSSWKEILEEEIAQAESLEKRLNETKLDSDTKEIIKHITLLRLGQEIVNYYY
jgi:2'-5' RNA ligase